MANVYKGIGVHWGVNSSTLSVVTGKFQTREHEKKAEMEVIRDGDGTTVGKVYYDPNESATFEFYPSSATPGGQVAPILPNIGDMLTVTDSVYTGIASSYWLVEGVDTKSANNGAMKVNIKLAKYPAITS